jgi:ferric-dicitrate binding protein FerR (iron transport regulator)
VNGDVAETKRSVLEWMLEALDGPVSDRKRLAFVEWLAGEDHNEIKFDVISSSLGVDFK